MLLLLSQSCYFQKFDSKNGKIFCPVESNSSSLVFLPCITQEFLSVNASFEELLNQNFVKLQQYFSPRNCFPCASFWLIFALCAVTKPFAFYPAVALFHLVLSATHALPIFVHSLGGTVPLFSVTVAKGPCNFLPLFPSGHSTSLFPFGSMIKHSCNFVVWTSTHSSLTFSLKLYYCLLCECRTSFL